MAELITSAANERLKRVRRLLGSARDRDETGLFVAEGEDLVAAALDAGIAPVEAFVDAERPALADRLDASPVVPDALARVSELGHPPRVLAVFRRSDLPRPGEEQVALALWDVADPGNVGTLLRTADAFGPARVCLSARCADPTGPKALRASVGALFRVPVTHFDDTVGRRVALVAHGGEALSAVELGEAVTFVLGAERAGVPADLAEACDAAATIPLAPGAESLNVAATGAIALYELRRRLG
jgi:TrmH family RNA methyltransferase